KPETAAPDTWFVTPHCRITPERSNQEHNDTGGLFLPIALRALRANPRTAAPLGAAECLDHARCVDGGYRISLRSHRRHLGAAGVDRAVDADARPERVVARRSSDRRRVARCRGRGMWSVDRRAGDVRGS